MFQSTHSRRVRHYSSLPIAPVFWVSIHALTKSATFITLVLVVGRRLVSIHALTKSATSLHFVISTFRSFQSTHSRRVRRPSSRHSPRVTSSFNPRTHEECDSILPGSTRMPRVSIHALTKSATAGKYNEQGNWDVSIHALTKSATFLSHSPFFFQRVSIHALTKSATSRGTITRRSTPSFNPRTHEECDSFVTSTYIPLYLFQSTHSRRVRHTLYIYQL